MSLWQQVALGVLVALVIRHFGSAVWRSFVAVVLRRSRRLQRLVARGDVLDAETRYAVRRERSRLVP